MQKLLNELQQQCITTYHVIHHAGMAIGTNTNLVHSMYIACISPIAIASLSDGYHQLLDYYV